MANQVLFGHEVAKKVIAAAGTVLALKVAVVALPLVAIAAYAIHENQKKKDKKK
jgi:hypothetical protein